MTSDLDMPDEILGLLVETLSVTDRVLKHTDLVRIRNLAHHLEEEILRYWSELPHPTGGPLCAADEEADHDELPF